MDAHASRGQRLNTCLPYGVVKTNWPARESNLIDSTSPALGIQIFDISSLVTVFEIHLANDTKLCNVCY